MTEPTLGAFAGGYSASLETYLAEVRDLYLADSTPWVIGYSGGKDSSAVVQLVWLALAGIPADQRAKPIHVITTDTMVENPVVSAWVNSSLSRMRDQARELGLPIHAHLLTPNVTETFWVNLIGRGYPAPRPKFRWCTERLKIKPSTRFIEQAINENGEVILLLGARKSESAARAAAFKARESLNVRDRIARHPKMQNALVYTPIEAWDTDDVWLFLMRTQNPWGHSNKDLMALYRGASDDNECPVVVDTSTPSCGNSRFGCWTCTLVDQDKSMAAMIQNDHEKEWMLPLLNVRNQLDFRGDEAREREAGNRDFRRMGGFLSFYETDDGQVKIVRGPYVQRARADWLRLVLKAQETVRSHPLAPDHVRDLELISFEELEEIRRLWVEEKREVEDLVPAIYEEVTGRAYPGEPRRRPVGVGDEVLETLREVVEGNDIAYETVRNLLTAEWQYRSMGSRRGLFKDLEKILDTGAFVDEEQAIEHVERRARRRRETHEVRAEQIYKVSEGVAATDATDNEGVESC